MIATLGTRPPSFAALRAREFARLDAGGHTYLDYTGSALYPASLIEAERTRLLGGVYGNPHSDSPASRASTERVESARLRLLRFLDADPAEWCVVFTANASGAMRLVGSAFPWTRESSFVLSADAHNSVNGMREFARAAGASMRYVGLDEALRPLDPTAALRAGGRGAPALFSHPAQSNFSGVQHPSAHARAARSLGYHVLVDAASYAPTHPISIDELSADFVALSFYKMFGYPTGVGALVARHDALALLRPSWFAGGTVEFASVQNELHRLREGPEAFEEGTPAFLSIAAVEVGLDFLDQVGMKRVAAHVTALTTYALEQLARLDRVVVYGPRDCVGRGGTIAFNLLDGSGSVVPYEQIEAEARAAGISIRGGCFCNPGASEHAFGTPADAARACLLAPGAFSHARLRACLGDRAVGALRLSLGLPSNRADVDRLIDFLAAAIRRS